MQVGPLCRIEDSCHKQLQQCVVTLVNYTLLHHSRIITVKRKQDSVLQERFLQWHSGIKISASLHFWIPSLVSRLQSILSHSRQQLQMHIRSHHSNCFRHHKKCTLAYDRTRKKYICNAAVVKIEIFKHTNAKAYVEVCIDPYLYEKDQAQYSDTPFAILRCKQKVKRTSDNVSV